MVVGDAGGSWGGGYTIATNIHALIDTLAVRFNALSPRSFASRSLKRRTFDMFLSFFGPALLSRMPSPLRGVKGLLAPFALRPQDLGAC